MFSSMKSQVCIYRLLCLSCYLLLQNVCDSRELEIYLGPASMAMRQEWSTPNSPSSTIEITQANVLKRHLTGLDLKFKKQGGYDLIGRATHLRWAWLSSVLKTWVMQIPFNLKDKNIFKESLLKSRWTRESDGTFVNKNFRIMFKDSKVILGHKLDTKALKEQSGYWNIPSCQWFQVRAFKPMFNELARRQPRLDALLSHITEVNFSWLQGDLIADIQLTESEKATALVLSVNAGIDLAKRFVMTQGPYDAENWQLLDFISYSQQSLNLKTFELMFDRLYVQSYGRVFQIKYGGVGDFGKFLSTTLPRQIFTLILALAPHYSKNRDQIGKLIRSNSSKASQGSKRSTVSEDTCESEIKMIKQAVEFYNLDHLKQGSYEQIKPKLFEEGYLPDNLTCDGALIKDVKLFSTGADGSLIRHKPLE